MVKVGDWVRVDHKHPAIVRALGGLWAMVEFENTGALVDVELERLNEVFKS